MFLGKGGTKWPSLGDCFRLLITAPEATLDSRVSPLLSCRVVLVIAPSVQGFECAARGLVSFSARDEPDHIELQAPGSHAWPPRRPETRMQHFSSKLRQSGVGTLDALCCGVEEMVVFLKQLVDRPYATSPTKHLVDSTLS